MTWRELFEFVAVAQHAGIDPSAEVDFEIDEQDMVPTGMFLYVDPSLLDTGGR